MLPVLSLALLAPTADPAPALDQPPNTWVKRSPLAGGPPSPGLGYECSLVWDAKHRRVVRFAGHNQGGGGEQNAETWTFDPLTAKWELKEPNTSPPGACCNQQNVFDKDQNRMIRFPAFSGSHGWQWFRENYLSNSTVWTYDLGTNTWRDRRPLPAPRIGPLRCAAWDTDHGVAVVFGGEGTADGTFVYDPYTNTWRTLRPKVHPEPRSGGNMAYDPVGKRHILFGTQFGNDRRTWAFDLKTGEWTDLMPKAMPPTDRNDAVLAYDPAAKKVVALVRVIDKETKGEVAAGHVETWAYDPAANTWAELSPAREPDGWHNRRRVMVAMPELNALLVEAYVNPSDRLKGTDREQQIWTYRAAAATPADEPGKPVVRAQPRVVDDVRAAVIDAKRVRLGWTDVKPDVAGFHVERAPVEVFSEDQVVRLKKDTPPLAQPSAGAIKAIGRFERLTKAPVPVPAFTFPEFTDTTIDLTKPTAVAGEALYTHRFAKEQLDPAGKPYRFGVYAYRVVAVNKLGVEGGPSAYVLTIPSAVQHVFAKEEGATCHLKWAASPEAGITGYRVYRMEGPKVNGPGQPVTRLTAESVAGTTFTDAKATTDTKRYWVVAVDALGQEGVPSAPAWSWRQFRKYYEPFTGAWHQ